MKTFAAILVLTAYLATDVAAGDNDCPFHKYKDQCEQASPKGKYKLKDSGASSCECQCDWKDDKNGCNADQTFVKKDKKKWTGKGKNNKAKFEECYCEWKPCEKTCVEMNPNEKATAVDSDYKQAGREDQCEC